MTYPSNVSVYGNAVGSASVLYPIKEARDPTTNDTNYKIFQTWFNTSTEILWVLTSLSSSNGVITANWQQNSGSMRTLTGDTGGAVSPDDEGNLNILGTSGQITVTGTPGTNTLTLALAGGGTAIDSFIPDSGTSPVVPASNGSVTMSGSGSIQSVGGTNQLTYQLTGLTNHSVLVGAGTTTITKVAPSATSGIPFVSQGSSADPAFTTAVVAGGGTGATSFTAYAPVCGGTTTTGTLQSASSGISNSGYVLTSTGASSVPTWQSTSTIGPFVQQVRSQTQAVTTTGTTYPATSTTTAITNANGAEAVNVTITPKNASNILVIEACIYASDTGGASPACWAASILQDGVTNALCVVLNDDGEQSDPACMRYYKTAGDTSAQTYRLYFGPVSGNSTSAALNALYLGGATKAWGGGALTTSLYITEYTS